MFKPLHRFVTVLLDPRPRTTPGGIELPDKFADKLRKGTVRGVGPGDMADEKPIALKPGDRVLVYVPDEPSKTSRTMLPGEPPSVQDGDVKCSLLDYSEIFGKYEDDPANIKPMKEVETSCATNSYDGPAGFTHPV